MTSESCLQFSHCDMVLYKIEVTSLVHTVVTLDFICISDGRSSL